jgi:hypothetical protein
LPSCITRRLNVPGLWYSTSACKKSHPDVTRQDIIKAVGSHRAELREGLERFLTQEQLKKWDAEVAKAKEFLGYATA